MWGWTRVHEFSKFNIDAAQGHCIATVHSTLGSVHLCSNLTEHLCERKEIAG